MAGDLHPAPFRGDIAMGIDQKSALKRIARERGLSKSEAYRLMLAERERS